MYVQQSIVQLLNRSSDTVNPLIMDVQIPISEIQDLCILQRPRIYTWLQFDGGTARRSGPGEMTVARRDKVLWQQVEANRYRHVWKIYGPSLRPLIPRSVARVSLGKNI